MVEIKESSTELKSLEIKTDEPSVEFKSLVALVIFMSLNNF